MKPHLRLALSVPLLVAAACGGSTPPAAVGAASAAVTTPEIDAKLAAADRKDGTEDKVVHRCAGCALHMDGKAELAVTVGAYQLHLCGAKCLERFQKDALGELGRLKVE